MWVVVASPGARFGQVGLVRQEDWDQKYEQKVLVQFGNDGPFRSYVKGNLLPLAPLVRAVEQRIGCEYDPDMEIND